MKKQMKLALEKANDFSDIQEIREVSGGDINQAFYVKTREKAYFIKGNENVPTHFFRVEAKGLSLIKDTQTIGVPAVHYYDEPEHGEKGVIVMDWVQGENHSSTSHNLGESLAHMHQHTNTHHGLDEDTFIGTLPQPNAYYDNWLHYYKNHRIIPQFDIAIERGRMPKKRRERMEKLIERLGEWIDPQVKASLLHGDLWGGNWMAGPHGMPYLIDPSVFYGDRAFEIAFTELFGGFSHHFYEAYQHTNPLPANYEDVKPLYQLYYLLVHLNLFGEVYGGSVDRILMRYM